MNEIRPESNRPLLLRTPAAWLPIVLSLAALGLVVGFVATHAPGARRQADEGWEAHTYQLLMVAQLLIGLYFAVRWLPREPKNAVLVMILQAMTAFTALAVLFWMEHSG